MNRGTEGQGPGSDAGPLSRFEGSGRPQNTDLGGYASGPVAVTFAVAWGYSSAGRAPAWHAATAERSTTNPSLKGFAERFSPSYRLSLSTTKSAPP